jgi:hypothetical protein
MATEIKETFVMATKPKGFESSAIQLTKDIWKIEDELNMIYSSAKKAYESYGDLEDTGALLKIDGTLVVKFSSEKECKSKFKELKDKMTGSSVLPAMNYGSLKLETYKITKQVQGKLEDVTPKALVDFLRGQKQKVVYDPKRIFFEFQDPKNNKNFIRITFDKVGEGETLLLNVTVESTDISYARETIKAIQGILRK